MFLLFFIAGIALGSMDYVGAFTSMGSGTAGMFETMIVAVLVAAISALMQADGGFEAVLEFIAQGIIPYGAQLLLAANLSGVDSMEIIP